MTTPPSASQPSLASRLERFTELAAAENGLVIVTTARSDHSMQASVVNAGVLPDPFGPDQVVGFVTYGKAKLTNLRARPFATVTARSGPRWITVEGPVRLVGPHDLPAVDAERLRLLRREVFTAAGGTHDDWDEYDRVMSDEGRTVVLLRPTRVYSN